MALAHVYNYEIFDGKVLVWSATFFTFVAQRMLWDHKKVKTRD